MSEFQASQISPTVYDSKVNYQPAAKPRPGVEQAQTASQQAENQPRMNDIKPQEKPASTSTKTKLKFRVDKESNDVTVLILDAKSHEVIRTVPPEELSELTPGDLINLSR